jgi:DedD protein
MGLLSFLKRPAASAASAGDAQSLDSLRSRARRRLIGAAVLVLIGVVVLPLLFDTAPRPVAVDIPIEIPGKERVPPLAASGKTVASGSLAAPTTAAPVASEPPARPQPSPDSEKPAESPTESRTVDAPAQAPAEKAVEKPAEPAPQAAAAESARALAALEARPAPAKTPAVARYVVQVGAFSEAASARDARQRVEKLGLKTYTQVVETAAGPRTRVRVGPFEERADADRTAAKIKQSGLPAAVLGL